MLEREKGVVQSACLLFIVPDKEAAHILYGPTQERWGAPLPGMDIELLNSFYTGMSVQHQTTMGNNPHICEHFVPLPPSSLITSSSVSAGTSTAQRETLMRWRVKSN